MKVIHCGHYTRGKPFKVVNILKELVCCIVVSKIYWGKLFTVLYSVKYIGGKLFTVVDILKERCSLCRGQ